MNTKKLYNDLLIALDKNEISFERHDAIEMVLIENGYDSWLTVEPYLNGYTGGVATMHNDYVDVSNVGCPDFANVDEAIDWLVSH